ncbi:MAG TPA: Mur ligase family protein [Bacilli bacterium]|nr:Mur ligase family protein [Bacilli bacterium]HQA56017.1 Mur ligase family protein [Bacilli bacterium]
MKSIDQIISSRNTGDYQRDNFDRFLSKISFHYGIPSIHVAGTNGKGSTACYIASIYRQAGYKVGLFISPSLKEINEMITINGEAINDEEIEDIINMYRRNIIHYDLSAFEVETLIALTYFSNNEVDIAIIECGMGGLIDATNIFTPILSIITSVSMEHTQFLGKSLTEIAEQKAGIIKDGVPVLLGDMSEEVISVMSQEAREKDCHIHSISIPNNVLYSYTGYTFDYLTYRNLKIKSIGLYSVQDACLAIEAVQMLSENLPVSDEQIAEGLYDIHIPVRMEVVHINPLVILDGAHNPEAMENLMIAIEKVSNNRPIHVVFASFKDKNFSLMLNYIGQAGEVILTTFDHPRARTKEDYFLYADEYEFYDDPHQLVTELIANYPDDVILITGSLAFAGHMRDFFKDGEDL